MDAYHRALCSTVCCQPICVPIVQLASLRRTSICIVELNEMLCTSHELKTDEFGNECLPPNLSCSMRALASAVIPAIPTATWSSIWKIFSATVGFMSRSLCWFFFSAHKTIPSFANIPIHVPACPTASIAYSTFHWFHFRFNNNYLFTIFSFKFAISVFHFLTIFFGVAPHV